jgi:hypothetical protein
MFDDVIDLIKVFIVLIIGFILLTTLANTLYPTGGFGYLVVGLFIVFGVAVFFAGIKKLFD